VPERINRSPGGDVRLELIHANLPASEHHPVPLHDLSLCVRSGEIVGIAGVAGNGQDELMQAIAGEVKFADAGDFQLFGEPAGRLSPGARRRLGLCSVPEERLGHAAVPSMSLSENAFLTAHHRMPMSLGVFIRAGRSGEFAQEVIDRFNVQCKDKQTSAGSLSGGNLQKFIVGRELLQAPGVLVVSQPTWGVDAGAAATIHKSLQDLASDGAAVLVISQDLDELMLISDSICALCAGRLSKLYPTQSITVQQVGLLMGGANVQDVASA